jgi:hypothetical protein
MAKAASTIEKGKRITGQDRVALASDLKKRYEKGATVRELHEQTGRSFGAIQRLLAEAGTAVRPRGGSRPKA